VSPRGADPGAPIVREAVVLRPRRTAIVAWICAAALFALFVVIAVVLRASDTGVYFRFADQIGMVVIGALLAGGVLLPARPRVRADADGIEVRNVLVTRTLPWDVVERVAFPDGASWARLELIGDDYLPVLAIQAADGQRAVDGIRRVRALHAAARAASAGG
jgi:Bacterial PH domain